MRARQVTKGVDGAADDDDAAAAAADNDDATPR